MTRTSLDRARAFFRALDAGDIGHDDRVTALVDLLDEMAGERAGPAIAGAADPGVVHIQPTDDKEWTGCDARMPGNPKIACCMVDGRGHGSMHKRITPTGRVTHQWPRMIEREGHEVSILRKAARDVLDRSDAIRSAREFERRQTLEACAWLCDRHADWVSDPVRFTVEERKGAEGAARSLAREIRAIGDGPLPSSSDCAREDLSRETVVTPRPVSDEFIAALKQAGARPSLIHALEASTPDADEDERIPSASRGAEPDDRQRDTGDGGERPAPIPMAGMSARSPDEERITEIAMYVRMGAGSSDVKDRLRRHFDAVRADERKALKDDPLAELRGAGGPLPDE